MYRNHEGYADPSVGEALANIIRQERKEKRRKMNIFQWQQAIINAQNGTDRVWCREKYKQSDRKGGNER